ncbi:thioesterase family protein [uncultured Maricaulis sp.]|uniref:acyl-CoA thioesterase n=1 Tax=uncultured Maricaulis sp. TaxID=174710 RepID=UPI0030D9E5D3|tara:strand:- start:70684 stop:71097 length:414 start_codon:yes stop_codon:yes gene_type:complete
MVFRVDRRVRFADVDAAGIVFYPRYFEMINACVEDWFETGLEHGFDAMIVQGNHAIPLAHIEVDFKAPSRLDDELAFKLVVTEVGRSSFKLKIEAWHEDVVRIRADLVLVYIDMDKHVPVRIPEVMRARMLTFEEVK